MPAPEQDSAPLSQPGLVEELRARIAEVCDPGTAPRMRASMQSAMPFRGRDDRHSTGCFPALLPAGSIRASFPYDA